MRVLGAKRRLADEYDVAHGRGEVQKRGGDRTSKVSKRNIAPAVADIGLTRKQVPTIDTKTGKCLAALVLDGGAGAGGQ